MPILPILDLLILAGWTSLVVGFILKAINLTTNYNANVFGVGPLDFLIMAGVFMLFSLTLAARTWVKSYEYEQLMARHRANAELAHFDAVENHEDDRTRDHAEGAPKGARDGREPERQFG